MIAQVRRDSEKIFSAVFSGPEIKTFYNILHAGDRQSGREESQVCETSLSHPD